MADTTPATTTSTTADTTAGVAAEGSNKTKAGKSSNSGRPRNRKGLSNARKAEAVRPTSAPLVVVASSSLNPEAPEFRINPESISVCAAASTSSSAPSAYTPEVKRVANPSSLKTTASGRLRSCISNNKQLPHDPSSIDLAVSSKNTDHPERSPLQAGRSSRKSEPSHRNRHHLQRRTPPLSDLNTSNKQNLDLASKLAAQLKTGTYECMVCYDSVRPRDQIWTCSRSCFAVFHAKCVRVWASSSASGPSTSAIEGRPDWRCPGCQFRCGKFLCGAWKESAGRALGGQLQCDETCSVAKRNKAFAEALNVDVAVRAIPVNTENIPPATTSSGELQPLDTQLQLVKYAYQNLVWTRGMEKILSDFVNDSTRKVHNYTVSKAGAIQFIVGMAPYYNLDVEVGEKNNVTFRKRMRSSGSPSCTVPTVSVSTIAMHYRTLASMAEANGGQAIVGAFASLGSGKATLNGSRLLETNDTVSKPMAPISSLKSAMNGFLLTNVSRVLDDQDLREKIEPVLGKQISITWTELAADKNNCVVQLVDDSGDMSAVEHILASKGKQLRDLLVMDNLAEDVELCWMNHKLVVTEKLEIGNSGGKKRAAQNSQPVVDKSKGETLGTGSRFSALKYEFEDD
ncbi:Transcriptional repressor NF-X1 [Entophlyctis sp. JEL0112]|nr:Transcriptional repressor NF-X1 [Entophlyctis sp. JEL0112]